jgi:hypothetical protein
MQSALRPSCKPDRVIRWQPTGVTARENDSACRHGGALVWSLGSLLQVVYLLSGLPDEVRWRCEGDEAALVSTPELY